MTMIKYRSTGQQTNLSALKRNKLNRAGKVVLCLHSPQAEQTPTRYYCNINISEIMLCRHSCKYAADT